MIWYRREIDVESMPKGESAILEGRFDEDEGLLSIVLTFNELETTYETELWSKKVKSSLQPHAEYSTEDVQETYGHKAEKEKEKLERLTYESWITHVAGNLDDMDKAKDLLSKKGIL